MVSNLRSQRRLHQRGMDFADGSRSGKPADEKIVTEWVYCTKGEQQFYDAVLIRMTLSILCAVLWSIHQSRGR